MDHSGPDQLSKHSDCPSSSWETEQVSTNLFNFGLVANFEEINFVGYGASSLLQLHRIINSLAGLNEPD